MDAEIDANHFYLILPTPHDRAHNPPRGHITVYTRALTFGLNLPFHPFVKALCGLHRISPAQLSPNCWVTINSMIILWRKFLSLDLSVEEFLYCYSLRASPRQKGFFYITSHTQSKPPVPPVVIGKTSSAHGWKPQYFFVGGDFNSHPLDAGRPVGTQTVFNKYCRFSFSFSFKIPAWTSIYLSVRSVLAGEVVDRPTLSVSALSRVEKILSLSPDRRRASVLNTKANQRLYGLLIKLPPPRESIVPPADLLSGKSPLSFFPVCWWVWSTCTQVNLLF